MAEKFLEGKVLEGKLIQRKLSSGKLSAGKTFIRGKLLPPWENFLKLSGKTFLVKTY